MRLLFTAIVALFLAGPAVGQTGSSPHGPIANPGVGPAIGPPGSIPRVQPVPQSRELFRPALEPSERMAIERAQRRFLRDERRRIIERDYRRWENHRRLRSRR